MPYLNLDNFKLYYEIQGNENTDRPPLLFIHGLGASTRDWEYQIPYFKDNWRIITMDLRGHGKSDKPDMPYSVSLFTADIVQALQQLNIKPVHVVGHSLGGMVAFQLALDFPNLVKSLIIINSAPAVEFPSLILKLHFYMRRINVKLFGMKKLSKSLAQIVLPKPEQAQLREIFIQRWEENDPAAYRNALKAFIGWNVKSRISTLQCPTLIVTGDRDYTPVPYKQQYTSLIPNARLVVIPDSGHLTIIDQSARLNAVLQDFLMNI